MIVFSASKKEFIDAMFERLESKDYSVISYEVETQRTSDGVVHRATIVIRAKGRPARSGISTCCAPIPTLLSKRSSDAVFAVTVSAFVSLRRFA